MRRLAVVGGLVLFVVGVTSLALTLYLWFGRWPASVKETVDHFRSVAATEGQPPHPLIVNARGRETQSLAGPWNAIIDPVGAAEMPLLAGLVPRNVKAETPSDLVEFSFDGGLQLEVPGDWNTQDRRLFFYEGTVWYQRDFAAEPRSGQRQFLWFGAANYRASVFVNGKRVGGHEGGFTPFNLEVTDVLSPGSNLVVVGVDNVMGDDDIPVQRTDWLNYGGITRDVLLLEVPATFIRSYGLWLDGDRIRGRAQLDGPKAQQELRVSIPELGVATAVTTSAKGFAEFELAAKPALWSPESPRLYRVELSSDTDAVADRIGFRSVAVEGTDILVNGKSVFLRGISLHEEAPGGGRAHSEAHARTLLGWAKELGCNFVRLAHYTHNEHMLRVADELGLFVWAEIPVYWGIAFDNPKTLERAQTQLSEMIERDRNRASVILWSIGNETIAGEERDAFMQALADHVRAEDPTRLVTAALLTQPEDLARWMLGDVLPSTAGVGPEEWEYVVNDPLGDIVDVPALNEYFGWYYSSALAAATPVTSHGAREVVLEHTPKLRIVTGLEKPFIVSEFGAGALAGFHAPQEELAVFSEEYQALVYEKQIEMLERQPDLRGMSPWILMDFHTPLRPHPKFQNYRNRKGLVSDTGQKKLAFDVLRKHYEERAAAQ